eukprot:3571242-Prymnesium_polylepis.1
MGARLQVNELQAQLLEARELHDALRERCAELQRQQARTEHGGSFENIEYLKNVVRRRASTRTHPTRRRSRRDACA